MKGVSVSDEEDDLLQPKIRRHPKLGLFRSFGNDVSSLTIAPFCERLWKDLPSKGKHRRKRGSTPLICQVRCLSRLFYNVFIYYLWLSFVATCHVVVLPPAAAITVISDVFVMEACCILKPKAFASLAEGRKCRDASERQDTPIRNHNHGHPPSTLPAWPAGSLSVREVSCCSPGTVQAGVQEWGLYGRKLRVLQDSSGVSISSFPVRVGPCFKVRLEGWGTQPLLLGQRRKMCTHPLSIFCLTWFIEFWFMTAGHVFLT